MQTNSVDFTADETNEQQSRFRPTDICVYRCQLPEPLRVASPPPHQSPVVMLAASLGLGGCMSTRCQPTVSSWAPLLRVCARLAPSAVRLHTTRLMPIAGLHCSVHVPRARTQPQERTLTARVSAPACGPR